MTRRRAVRALDRIVGSQSLEELLACSPVDREDVYETLRAMRAPGIRWRRVATAVARRRGVTVAYVEDRVMAVLASATELRRHDLYALIGVHSGATAADIRARWRVLAKRLHPDRGSISGNALFSQLHAAYEVLIDPVQRTRYDDAWRRAHGPALARLAAPAAAQSGRSAVPPATWLAAMLVAGTALALAWPRGEGAGPAPLAAFVPETPRASIAPPPDPAADVAVVPEVEAPPPEVVVAETIPTVAASEPPPAPAPVVDTIEPAAPGPVRMQPAATETVVAGPAALAGVTLPVAPPVGAPSPAAAPQGRIAVAVPKPPAAPRVRPPASAAVDVDAARALFEEFARRYAAREPLGLLELFTADGTANGLRGLAIADAYATRFAWGATTDARLDALEVEPTATGAVVRTAFAVRRGSHTVRGRAIWSLRREDGVVRVERLVSTPPEL
jgi:hypothetical protein